MDKIVRSSLLFLVLAASFFVGLALMPVTVAAGWIMGWIGLHTAFAHYMGYRFALKDQIEELQKEDE